MKRSVPVDQKPSPWEDADLPPECLAWVKEVDLIMKQDWYIDLDDAGASSEDILRYWNFDMKPADFVDWFAEKYDLIRLD